jgi:hypothetical protein
MAQPTSEPLSKMTVLELTRLVSAQDDRWARILTYAQSTRNPAAPAGIAFFKKTWRPAMTVYFESVVSQYDSAARAPERIVKWWLDAMSDTIYPAARKVGLPDSSFVFPDIVIEQSGHPATPAGPPMVATRGTVGAEAPPADRGDDVGQKVALGGVGIIFLGMGIYALNARQLAKMPL